MKIVSKKPEGITIFAIFLLLDGIGGIIFLLLMLGIFSESHLRAIIFSLFPQLYLIILFISDIIGRIFLLICSYGLFKLKKWSRILSVYSSIYLLTLTVFSIILLFSSMFNLFRRMPMSGFLVSMLQAYYKGIIIYSSLFGIALYLALIYYMTRKEIKSYFNKQKTI